MINTHFPSLCFCVCVNLGFKMFVHVEKEMASTLIYIIFLESTYNLTGVNNLNHCKFTFMHNLFNL